jgi:23S rRNA pseudouridine1911/1915/1917 synthase
MGDERSRRAVVDVDDAGATLAAVVRAMTDLSWSKARKLITTGRVRVDGEDVFDAAARLGGGEVIEVNPTGRKRAVPELGDERVVFVDHHLLVVDKPAGLITVPHQRQASQSSAHRPDSLVARAEGWLARQPGRKGERPRLFVVQRLDLETSGVLVFARTRQAKKALENQLRKHSVERVYVGIADGIVSPTTIRSHLMPDRGDGRRGSWRGSGQRPPREAKHAVTHVGVEATFEAATLVSCELETGRQHQIRIHLSESGHPLWGDRRYGGRGMAGRAPRTMLHARSLGVRHPDRGELMRWRVEPPADFRGVLDGLRA